MAETNIIALTNQKGGVGKTTSTVNLAASLAMLGKRVLLIDLDPQGNASLACGGVPEEGPTMMEVLLGDCRAIDAIHHAHNRFDYIPSDQRLTVAEVRCLQLAQQESRLAMALRPIQQRYDFILIDCPPALNILTVNALVAATGVIVPVQCEYYALEGMTALLKTISQVREHANPELELLGVLRTLYDGRNRLTQEVSGELARHFGDKLLSTIIPRNVRLAEAPSHGLPVMLYDSKCQGAISHLALAAELLRRLGPMMLTSEPTTMELHSDE